MIEWNRSVLTLEFDSEPVDGRCMSLVIFYQDRSWEYLPLEVGKTTWSTDISLPGKITMWFGGKGHNGTKVDEQGKILENMSVTIDSLALDGIPCWEYWLEHSVILECDRSNEIILGKTISDNGRVELMFDGPNAFYWLSRSKLD